MRTSTPGMLLQTEARQEEWVEVARLRANGDGAIGSRPPAWRTFAYTIVWGAAAFTGLQILGELSTAAALAACGSVLLAAGVQTTKHLRRRHGKLPWWLHWDAVGLVVTAAIFVLLSVGWSQVFRTGGLGRAVVSATLLGLLGVGFSVVGAVGLARAEGIRPRLVPGRLLRVWIEPPADWTMFGLGAILALPTSAMHTEFAIGTDSVRLLASIVHVQHSGPALLTQTQEVFLPHIILGPIVAVGGVAAANIVSMLSFVMLAGVVSYVTWRVTHSAVGAVGSVLALLSFTVLLAQATMLPMYPAMLAFAYVGGWLAHRAMTTEVRRVRLSLLSALFLVLAAEAHGVGQIFLLTPFVLLIARPSLSRLRSVGWIYLFGLLFLLPRIAVNFADGGLAHFLSSRTEWMVTRGYLALINDQFWGHPTAVGPAEYLGTLAARFITVSGWTGVIALVLAAMVFFLARGRGGGLALLAVGVLMAGLLFTRAPPFPRYLNPVLPGAAIAAGATLALIAGRGRWWKHVALFGLCALVVSATVSGAREAVTAEERRGALLNSPVTELAQEIDDADGVLGSRSVLLLSTATDVLPYDSSVLTEEEFLTYLTWPSDAEVVRMMGARDIGWVLVVARKRLEVGYHETWTLPTYGLEVRHTKELRRSQHFCLVANVDGHRLYKLGQCES